MVGRAMKTGRIAPLFFVDEAFAEQVLKHVWCPDRDGYLKTTIKGKYWSLHQYVWFLAHGTKAGLIDHINGIKVDCRLCNMRQASCRQNLHNRSKPKKHGLPRGVYRNTYQSEGKVFFSAIWVDGRRKYLGSFYTPEEALAVYENALKQYL